MRKTPRWKTMVRRQRQRIPSPKIPERRMIKIKRRRRGKSWTARRLVSLTTRRRRRRF